MSIHSKTVRSTAIAAALVSGSLAGVANADESTDKLLDRIDALQAELEAVKAEARVNAESEGDAIARVLDDAEQRSTSIFAQSDEGVMTSGHNGKFLLASPDGDFTFTPSVQLQTRFVANFSPEDGDAFEDFEQGWEIRRAKIGFAGNVFSEDLTYNLVFAFGRNSGDAALENAFLQYTPENGAFSEVPGLRKVLGSPALGLRIGQYKDPTFFGEFTSSKRQMAADRSLVNEELAGGITDFIQGVQILINPEGAKWKGLVGFTDSPASATTDFTDDSSGGIAYAFHGRFDYLVSGDSFSPFKDFTALKTEGETTRVGGGFFVFAGEDEVDDGDGGLSTEDVTGVFATADISYESESGLSLFGAGYLNFFDDGIDDNTNFGAEVIVAQLLGEDRTWEVFGRYDVIFFDDDLVAPVDMNPDTEDFFHELTVGVNKYFEGHKLKMTTDIIYLPNGNPGGNSGLGLRNQDDFEDQVAIRGQIQLLL